MRRVLLTGNPGTEDVIADEAVEEIRGASVAWIRRGYGRVLVESNVDLWDLSESVLRMRSIHSATLVLAEGRISLDERGVDDVKSIVESSNAHEYIPRGGTFAVRAERSGEGHAYTSMDVARAAGDGVISSAAKAGWRPAVRLNSPSTIFSAIVIDDSFYFGVLLTGERSRHRRRYRVYDHPAALKPTLAYVMLRLAGASDGEHVMDPMCGGGTVAIEAAYLFESSPVTCLDKDARHIEGAIMNAIAARVKGRIRFIVGDATRLPEYVGEASIDVVVSNPPYGIRLGDPYAVRALYRRFVPSLARALAPGGRAAIITTESSLLASLARDAGLTVSHVRRVRHGDLWASILVLEKEA